MTAVDIARLFLFVREAQDLGQNRGLRVEAIQHWSGGATGDSWCLEQLWLWLDLYYKGKCPVPRMQACHDLYEYLVEHHLIVDFPEAGDLYLYLDRDGHAHHCGLVTIDSPVVGIAGNTSADGTSSNGSGTYEHELHVGVGTIVYGRLPAPEGS